jgi:hypothetical protein
MHRSCCCMPDICQCRRTPGLPPRPHQRSVNGATAVTAAAAAGGSAGGLGLGLLKQRTKGAKFPSGLWALWALWSSKMAKTTSRKQPTRVRYVSIFLAKNRRPVGKSQSNAPACGLTDQPFHAGTSQSSSAYSSQEVTAATVYAVLWLSTKAAWRRHRHRTACTHTPAAPPQREAATA